MLHLILHPLVKKFCVNIQKRLWPRIWQCFPKEKLVSIKKLQRRHTRISFSIRTPKHDLEPCVLILCYLKMPYIYACVQIHACIYMQVCAHIKKIQIYAFICRCIHTYKILCAGIYIMYIMYIILYIKPYGNMTMKIYICVYIYICIFLWCIKSSACMCVYKYSQFFSVLQVHIRKDKNRTR